MIQEQERLKKFVEFLDWFKQCKGKEKAEGQIFFDRLLQAFGNGGVHQAGAVCEDPVKKKSGKTGFADLVWRPRVIIELKKRGENLKKHYHQAEEYWMRLVPNRPQYMILCNFDEFWIYDLNVQLNDPVQVIETKNLEKQHHSLAFLFPKAEKPFFNNNNVEVTEDAAKILGKMYLSLQQRNIDPHRAQRFVLQLVVALFSEDVNLIPKHTLQKILREAVKNPVTQKELTDLFQAMATEQTSKKPKKYSAIPYFNGGLFNSVEPVELKFNELDLLAQAADQDWSKVRPSVFGAIFESSMDPNKRHGHGVHFTSELDIQKIVNPTIVRPFRQKIENAKNKKELAKVLEEIQNFKVLDPACGSGNFLYIAFRELRRLEIDILERMDKNFDPKQMRFGLISPKNFYGIDTNEFGLELAKVALCIGRKLSADEFGMIDNVLPFDNLDENFIPEDALFVDWPDSDAIIGNPPFQSKNRIQQEMGVVYLNKLRKKYPSIPGMADYCVYWIRKAHDRLKDGCRAGLVGTNSIRENESRVGGLDYITEHGATLTEAVSSQVWSGDAAVHVSIVNWVKGDDASLKKIYFQIGDSLSSPWDIYETKKINSSLSKNFDVSKAKRLKVNVGSDICYQGQTHGHPAFLVARTEAEEILKENPEYSDVLLPYLTADQMLRKKDSSHDRYVIDFQYKTLVEAKQYKKLISLIENAVLPEREKAAAEEEARNKLALEEDEDAKINLHHKNFLNKWWALSYPREELISKLKKLDRYVVVPRHTKRPIFCFVSSKINPGDALVAFALDDDYSFGILQSGVHWEWFKAKGSTLTARYRYTSKSVFDTFPWPQKITKKQVTEIASLSKQLRKVRSEQMKSAKTSLRGIYQAYDLPGANELKVAQANLDEAVRSAYGMTATEDALEFLLELNSKVSEAEKKQSFAQKPGIPQCIKNPKPLISDDCIEP